MSDRDVLDPLIVTSGLDFDGKSRLRVHGRIDTFVLLKKQAFATLHLEMILEAILSFPFGFLVEQVAADRNVGSIHTLPAQRIIVTHKNVYAGNSDSVVLDQDGPQANP